MRIAFGNSEHGYALRDVVLALLRELGHEVVDVGIHSKKAVDYPDIAAQVARLVSHGEAERGIILAGTAIGMCITANKFPAIRAAACYDEITAEITRRHNDLNVLCVPASMVGEHTVQRMIETWLKTPFDGGRHARRLEKLALIERENRLSAPPS